MSSESIPTSVYVHFPWCARKCPYCDFATAQLDPDAVPHADYADAALRELDAQASCLRGRRLVSVFFGGGTPSLWSPQSIGRVLRAVVGAFESSVADLEVTVECNPSSLDRGHAASLREHGVSRLSVGVQSLRDPHLRFLGRLHDAKGALTAVRDAVREIPRVSVDLMFGMPSQSVGALAEDIDRLVDLGIGHVSVYALTVEPRTPFGTRHRQGKLEIGSDDEYADLFEQARRSFERRGWSHYEVSNYAAAGEESRHNAHYWRGGDYLGLGAAAVGCLSEGRGRAIRCRNQIAPTAYLRRPTEKAETEVLRGPEIVREALMLGLRTSAGTDLVVTEARAGVNPRQGRERALERAALRGDLVDTGDRMWVPHNRWLKLDGIVRDLF